MSNHSGWCWADSSEAEHWHGFDCKTKEDAIREAREDYPNQTVWVRACDKIPASNMFSLDDLTDGAKTRAAEELEDGDEMLEWSPEAEEELSALLDAWIEKHVTFRGYEFVGDPIAVPP